MTADELTWVIAGALFAAVLVGWVLHWLWSLIARATSSERGQIRSLMSELALAEEAREEAEAQVEALEATLSEERIAFEAGLLEAAAERDARIADAQESADTAVREAKAEAQTAWEGLAFARQRIADLERDAS